MFSASILRNTQLHCAGKVKGSLRQTWQYVQNIQQALALKQLLHVGYIFQSHTRMTLSNINNNNRFLFYQYMVVFLFNTLIYVFLL